MIARTEVNSVKNKARLQAFKDNGVQWIDIVTMGDNKVCQDCLNIESKNPYTIEEAEGILPVHPQCRCEYVKSEKKMNTRRSGRGPGRGP